MHAQVPRAWLLGGWVPQGESCESDTGVRYGENGTWVADQATGTWDLQGPNLISLVHKKQIDGVEVEQNEGAAPEFSGVLLREVRDRVANSLQIVSAVLLQNAGRTKSAEARASLTDAHNRGMSVATIERQQT